MLLRRALARALAPALVLGLLAACDQKPEATPTAPAVTVTPQAPQLSAAPTANVAAAIGKNAATVCKAYHKTEGRLKAELAKNPNDATLKAQTKAIAAIIADACS